VVSLDEINLSRGLLGGLGIPAEEWARTHQEALREVERCLEAGRSVIVDDTNCFRFLRDNYRAIADRHGVRTTVIHLERPLELLRERIRENDQTQARASITEPVLLDLANKFEPPDADEHVIEFPPGVSADAWVARHLSHR
jgi:predicted kinase